MRGIMSDMQHETTQKTAVAWAVVILIAGLAGWYGYVRYHTAPTNTATTTPSYDLATITPTTNGSASTTAIEAVYKVIPKTNWDAVVAPDYKTAIAYSSSTTESVRTQLESSFTALQKQFATDPKNFRSWVTLGALHKMGGDYSFAASVWEYLTKVAPVSPTPFYNLGDLYQNSLHDYAKAELAYLQAMKLLPTDTNTYRSLFVMYENQYKTNTNAAEEILKKGIAANPKAYDLQVMLARYYKEHGRTAEAASMYEVAAKNAETAGQKDVAAQIRAEATQ